GVGGPATVPQGASEVQSGPPGTDLTPRNVEGGGGAWGCGSPSSHGPNEGIPQGNSPDAPANTPQRCNGGANDTTSEVTAAEAGAAWSRVPCPVCNVAPGYYCRVPGGVPGFVHQGRLQADAEPQGAAPAAAAAAPVAGSTPQPSGA